MIVEKIHLSPKERVVGDSSSSSINNDVLTIILTEIPNFLSAAECDHIIQLAQKKGLQTSSTVRDSIEVDIKNLGESTQDEFLEWDLDSNGQIDMVEVSLTFVSSAVTAVL